MQALTENWRDWPDQAKQQYLERLKNRPTPEPKSNTRPWRAIARPEQLPPAGDWLTWLILAGRGFGKTRTGAEYVREVKDTCPRIAIVAPTYADARDTCIEGESGLRAVCGAGEITKWNRSMGELEFANGAQAKLFSGEEPDRLRGPQHYAAWCDELAAWKQAEATWSMLMFGLRLGPRPRVVVTTTPRPIQLVRDLLAAPTTHITRGSTYDNRANLAESFFEQIVSRYEGTRLGRQELNAEILEDVPGALWKRADIDKARWTKPLPDMAQLVIAIDPSASSKDSSDEAGIVAAGKALCDCQGAPEMHGFLLGDYSRRGTPNEWAGEAVGAYHRHKAGSIIGEGNNGGEMVETVIRSLPGGANVPYAMVWASRGKETRAEPVSALYEQGKVHHVGSFPELEDECCSWVPGQGRSPNRIDALVWAVTHLDLIDGGPLYFE